MDSPKSVWSEEEASGGQDKARLHWINECCRASTLKSGSNVGTMADK